MKAKILQKTNQIITEKKEIPLRIFCILLKYHLARVSSIKDAKQILYRQGRCLEQMQKKLRSDMTFKDESFFSVYIGIF